MSTDIERDEMMQDATPAVEEEAPQTIEELLEFKRERVQGDMTPCPSCTLLVPINARRCVHCESNIEANNALVRETLRHIEEISGEIDSDGRTLDRTWRSLKNRIRRAVGASPRIEESIPEGDTRRVLSGVQAGDQITVVSTHGAWARVRTRDGREGWVYAIPSERA
jgi:hypothetical protein